MSLGKTEAGARKDVWRLGEGGSVTVQVTFGEFGGAYVSHCHNTVHEDFAMLMRYDILTQGGSIQDAVIPTPYPTAGGVHYLDPEILDEADPANTEYFDEARMPELDALDRMTRGGSVWKA